eukprot:m.78009 g.78009  ORF g.78009 m.78009 type:complete len:423 (+) comp9183_c0_seq1:228-1496(+)
MLPRGRWCRGGGGAMRVVMAVAGAAMAGAEEELPAMCMPTRPLADIQAEGKISCQDLAPYCSDAIHGAYIQNTCPTVCFYCIGQQRRASEGFLEDENDDIGTGVPLQAALIVIIVAGSLILAGVAYVAYITERRDKMHKELQSTLHSESIPGDPEWDDFLFSGSQANGDTGVGKRGTRGAGSHKLYKMRTTDNRDFDPHMGEHAHDEESSSDESECLTAADIVAGIDAIRHDSIIMQSVKSASVLCPNDPRATSVPEPPLSVHGVASPMGQQYEDEDDSLSIVQSPQHMNFPETPDAREILSDGEAVTIEMSVSPPPRKESLLATAQYRSRNVILTFPELLEAPSSFEVSENNTSFDNIDFSAYVTDEDFEGRFVYDWSDKIYPSDTWHLAQFMMCARASAITQTAGSDGEYHNIGTRTTSI